MAIGDIGHGRRHGMNDFGFVVDTNVCLHSENTVGSTCGSHADRFLVLL